MRMMSKKELSSEEFVDSEKVQNPNRSVDCKRGSAHPEEAQVFVRDLNQFVTVQLLEGTLAVLSLGKLCKDHGQSYQWGSGQEPRVIKNVKSFICKTDNFAPLSVDSESSSSCTTPSPELLGPEASLASGSGAAASSSADSVLGRSDETSSGKLGKESWESDKKDENDPSADMAVWLEDFTDNLISHRSACVHQHTFLRIRVRNILRKWHPGSAFFHSLPERPKLRRLLENQNNESLLHKTHWRSFTTSRKVW